MNYDCEPHSEIVEKDHYTAYMSDCLPNLFVIERRA